MFIVKKKKEYDKIWYQMFFLSVAIPLYGLVACIYAIPKLIIEDEMGGVIFLIISFIVLLGIAL